MRNLILSLRSTEKRAILLFLDVVMVALALAGTAFLIFGSSFVGPRLLSLWPLCVMLMIAAAGISMMLGLSRVKLKAFERSGVVKTIAAAVLLSLTSLCLTSLSQAEVPLRLHIVFGMLYFLGTAGTRFALLHILTKLYLGNTTLRSMLIYGAGKTGMQLASALKGHSEFVPIAFIDDNSALKGQIVQGLPIYHGAQLDEAIRETNPSRVVIAMPSADRPIIAKLERRLEKTGVEVHVVPSFAELIGAEAQKVETPATEAHRFLGRDALHRTIDRNNDLYRSRNIMVTGAGGSIGSELIRQLLHNKPAKLVLFEMSELALYDIEMELSEVADHLGIELVAVLGSVCDDSSVRSTLSQHDIEIVFHAAAYKHVPLVETNPIIGLKNNVLGTATLANAAQDAKVERFVLISSDKAVRPANVMGASKRMAELIIQDLATRSRDTIFSMVRFGNVLGSSGSVVPLFQDQVKRGGPVTLTHQDVTRYFMTVQEAAQLVLTSGSLAKGGEVFVLDMGRPVPVMKIARQVIENAGYSVRDERNPDGDIKIILTGLRPGEKMHEELIIGSGNLTTRHEKIFCVHERSLSEIEISRALKSLKEATAANNAEAALASVYSWVDGYQSLEREVV